MYKKHNVMKVFAMVAGLILPVVATGQAYPTRTITVLCWSAAGSPVDIFARVMAKLLTTELGQNVVVENRVGGSGVVLVNAMLKAPADGYLIAANTVSLASLFGEPGANFRVEDLQMVTRSQVDPYAMVAHTSTPFRTVDEFVAYARKKPDFVNVGGAFAMSGHRVAWELLADVAKFRTTWVAFQGGGPALTALAGGHIDIAATNPGNVKPFVDAGKVRVLAVSSEQRLDDFPNVPTYRERGWDVVRYQWRGIMAKAGTPQAVTDRLVAAIQKAQQTPEWKAYLKQVTQLDGYQGPDAFKATLLQDMKEMEHYKKKLGL